jgi:hypothetical protein
VVCVIESVVTLYVLCVVVGRLGDGTMCFSVLLRLV